VTAEEITRFTYESVAENIAVLENDQAEVLELELTEGWGAHRPTDLGDRRRYRRAVRHRRHHPRSQTGHPRGDTVLQAGDHVILLVESDSVGAITSMA